MSFAQWSFDLVADSTSICESGSNIPVL